MSTELTERLEARREEIEQAILTRIYSVEDPTTIRDPDYRQGLKAAVSAGLSYGLSAIESGETRVAPIPVELLTQARRAARSDVGFDTVLRRYVAGHTLLDDFIVQEAASIGARGRALGQGALRAEAVLLDRLIAAVAVEYNSEVEARSRSRDCRRAECVKRLLAGELADVRELDYDFGGWNIGAIAGGGQVEAALRALTKELDCRSLLVSGADGTVSAWFGGMRRLDSGQFERLAAARLPVEVRLSLGEPGHGLSGWRLTHSQALAGWAIVSGKSSGLVRYADVALLASVLQDETLTRSLRDLYLSPLAEERDGGQTLRSTLRAYFLSGRNSASAAAALGVTRQTVNNRLRVIEDRINRPLNECAVELETALRLEGLQD